jgi:hypothetical protein
VEILDTRIVLAAGLNIIFKGPIINRAEAADKQVRVIKYLS